MLTTAQVHAEDYFDRHEEGWHWYKGVKENVSDEEEDSQANESFLDKLRQYQNRLEEAKAEAVLVPTPQNVARYQKLQYEMLSRANKFALIWMQNLYKNPQLDFTSQYPVNQKARHIYLAEERRRKEQAIQELSQSYGLFFFFKNDCPYCMAFSPIVKQFSEKYNWEVLAISEDGEINEHFSRNVKDNGLSETWGVETYPSLFAVNPKTGHVIPIANGMISIEEMEERILTILDNDEESNAKH